MGRRVFLWEFVTELLALARRIVDFLRRRKSFLTLSVLRELWERGWTGISTGCDGFIISGHSASLFFLGSRPCPPASKTNHPDEKKIQKN